MRKIVLLALAMLAARMARRALARGGGDYAAVISALWELASLILAAGTANTAKTRNIEDRLNLLVPRIPVPQAAPVTGANGGQSSGGNSSYSASNSSYSTSNSSYSTSNSSYNFSNGIPGGGTFTVDGTNWLVAMQDALNELQGSYSNTVPAVNALQGSYSNTVPALNALQASHSNLVPAVNALQGSYSTTIAQLNNMAADHNSLVSDHNNLKQAIINSGLLH